MSAPSIGLSLDQRIDVAAKTGELAPGDDIGTLARDTMLAMGIMRGRQADLVDLQKLQILVANTYAAAEDARKEVKALRKEIQQQRTQAKEPEWTERFTNFLQRRGVA